MAERQLTLPGEIVKKSNALARAKWPVSSVWEPRLVALVASRVRVDDEDFQEYEIPIQEIVQEKQDGQTYQRVAAVVDNLMGRVVTILDPTRPRGWKKYTLFSKCELDPERNVLIARFDPDMKPHYLALSKHFTEYNVFEFLRLPSTYSQRLYEILKSWDDKKTKEKEYTLTELREMLGAEEVFPRYPDFRRYVLERAYKDIREKTSLYYEWEPIKRGQAVAAIRFIFSRTLIAKEAKEKTEAEQEEQSRKNNALFRAAHECLSKLGGTCTKSRPRKPKCQVCIRLLQKAPE